MDHWTIFDLGVLMLSPRMTSRSSVKYFSDRMNEVFASRPRTLAAVNLAYECGEVALAPLGSQWKRMRRICMEHLLSIKRLESFADHRAREAHHLVEDVYDRSQTGKPVNLDKSWELFHEQCDNNVAT
uniref:Uncharacterized protein n=1 Tax=Nelumbo nucifera TaxID=4432 RepID=A0A822YYS8_NELNU|nr:TPA_asm: hypothetical protein HUJ06_008328 [Nelumbo nucifera]